MREPWRTSLHGGHSGEFCEHASATLREMLEAAAACGYETFGVSEHAPRFEERFLYDSEREKGYTINRLQQEFDAYSAECARLVEEFSDRITVLRGFEAEVVPAQTYRERMTAIRERYAFDFMVGSVHYVHEIQIDGTLREFLTLLERCGGLEQAAVDYYDQVSEMAATLEPDVVGHLDLIRRNAPPGAVLDSPRIQAAADRALEAVRAAGAILDLNTAGWRKNLGGPYPAPWLVERAHRMGIGFCFGDDSHSPADVGAGVEDARRYLLENGVGRIRRVTRRDGAIIKEWTEL